MQLSFCAQAVQLFGWFSTCQGTILPFFEADPKKISPEMYNHAGDLGQPLPNRDERIMETLWTPMSLWLPRKPNHWGMQARWWLPFKGVRCWWTTWKRSRSHYYRGLLHWCFESYRQKSRRFCVGSWQEECSSTRTMLHPTNQWWLPSRAADLNSCNTCPIQLIWQLLE